MRLLLVSVLAAATAAFNATNALADNPAYAGARGDQNGDAVQRGLYLATAGNCMSCHTVAGGEPFAGGVAMNTDFGIIYSSNITPDPDAGIGSWTGEDFLNAMHNGKSADGSNLYPAFPYPYFTKLSEQDISDIFEYLKTVKASSSRPEKNKLQFPYNQRWLLSFWKMTNFKKGRFQSDETQSAEWNRGAYLVEGLSHCGACHTPRGPLGGAKEKLALSGGVILDYVPGGEIRKWSAVNLTPSPDGLAEWSVKEMTDYLATGYSTQAGSFGPMNKVIEHGTSKLDLGDVRAMATYLAALPEIKRSKKYTMDPADFGKAEVLYTIHCGSCHLPTGLGDVGLGPAVKGSSIVQDSDPSSLINVILYGAERPDLEGPTAWKKEMKPFKDKLSDEEIAMISTYLRSNWGNYGGAVNEKDVSKQR